MALKRKKCGSWGTHWTAKDIRLIKQWQEERVAGPEQARRLNRSYASWYSAVQRYGLKLVNRQGHNFNLEKRAVILDLLMNGASQAEISRRTFRCHSKISMIVAEFIASGFVIKLGRKGPYKVTADGRMALKQWCDANQDQWVWTVASGKVNVPVV